LKNRFLHSAYQIYKPIRKFLDDIPILGPLLVEFTRLIKDLVLSIYVFLSRYEWFIARPLQSGVLQSTVYLSPDDIVYKSNRPFYASSKLNQVESGSWDKFPERFKDDEWISGVKQIIKFGVGFEQSEFYQSVLLKIDSGEEICNCNNHQQWMNLSNQVLKLSGLIQSQQEIDWMQMSGLDGGLVIDIARDGSLLFVSGRLTFVIAKVLNVEIVPAKVRTRHSRWLKLRRRYEFLVTGTASRAYQPTMHPDLTYIPAQQNCVERLRLIKENLTHENGSLLELGANIGYFSLNFEKAGFDCTAVENSPIFLFCLLTQKQALHKDISIISKSFLKSDEIFNHRYDVVLALNLFHHFLRRKQDFEKLEFFLERLNCSELYFEPHVYEDPQLKHAYINMHEDEFVEFVRSKTRLSRSELIGRASDKRPLYKLY